MQRLIFSLVLTITMGCGPLNPLFAGGPYRGKVIDAETKEPIVGAVVLTVWYRSAPTLVGTPMDFLDAEEVLTNSSGEFVVGKNPPASMIPGTWVTGPHTTIFYPGYGHFPTLQIKPPSSLGLDKLNEALEQYAVIELPRLKTREEYREACTFLSHTAVPKEKKPNLLRILREGGDPCDRAFR